MTAFRSGDRQLRVEAVIALLRKFDEHRVSTGLGATESGLVADKITTNSKRSREAIVQIKMDFGVRAFNESIRSRDIVVGGVIPELD